MRESTGPPAGQASIAIGGTLFKHAVLLGNGAIGSLLRTHLQECCASFTTFDKKPSATALYCDVERLTTVASENLALADLVILALPVSTIAVAIGKIAKACRPDALIVETGSIKVPVERELPRLQLPTEIVGINPMFAPALGFPGNTVCIVPYGTGEGWKRVEKLIEMWKGHPCCLSPQEHDKTCAVVQAGVHATILAFAHLLTSLPNADRALEIAPPPCRALMLLAARVLSGSPDVYWEIQALNAFSEQARCQLVEGIGVSGSRHRQFAEWFSNLGVANPSILALEDKAASLMASIESFSHNV